MTEVDAILEDIASKLEKPNFGDVRGIAAKRKRAREDAHLRSETRQEQRIELARWVRSYKGDGGNSYASTLENIQDSRFAWGRDVAAALAMGHATLSISMDLDTHLANVAARYDVRLTDAGRAYLAKEQTAPEVGKLKQAMGAGEKRK